MDASAAEAHNARVAGDHQLRLELLPEPFVGRPDAPVVILMGNPGFSPRDLEAHGDDAFRAATLANLSHAPAAFPHYLLDPAFAWTSGAQWWRKHTREVLAEVGDEAASKGLLVLEALPHHSLRYKALETPSQRYTASLLSAAIGRGALVIKRRGPWMHTTPGLMRYRNLLELRNIQRMWITRRNLEGHGFDRLIDALRIHAASAPELPAP